MGEENPFALGCFFELTVLATAQVYLNDLKCSPTIQLDCFEFSPPRKVPLRHKLRKRHSMNKRNAQSNKVVAAHCEKIVWEVQETGKLARTLQERCNMLWQNADVRYEFARNFEVRKVLQQRFNLDGSPQLTSLSFRCYALHWSEYLCRWYIASSFYRLDESWLWHIQIHIMTYYDCRFAGLWWLTDTAWKISV